METLKSINLNNSNNRNDLYNNNLKYLCNLEISINKIIQHINNIKINDKILLSIYEYLNIKNTFHNIDVYEYNNLKIFLLDTMEDIIKLKNNLPEYKNMSLSDLKIICDEYIIFHNNIINNVKKCIHYYRNYNANLIDIYNSLSDIYNNICNAYNSFNLFFYSDKKKENDEFYINKTNKVQKELGMIVDFNEYLKNEIDNYDSIKTLSKNIDKSFLVKIKNISYR